MRRLTSVIIVSQGRPQSLVLTLDALRYQTLPEFEVIVVGGPEEWRAIETAGFAEQVNFAEFRQSNIAISRNIGIAAASGDFIAFLDDDAVPGSGWLLTLTDALRTSGADLAAGYVRGPDGIRYQFTGAFLFADATHEPIQPGAEIQVITASAGRAVEAMGTNAAYTKTALQEAGGFDPAFSYFLDESDLNWRLAREGALAAIAPQGQVVHALGASAQRSADRVPLTLYDIGRSTRVFLEKHFEGEAKSVLEAHRARHEKRLMRHVRAKRLKADRVPTLLESFDRGCCSQPKAEMPADMATVQLGTNHLMKSRADAPSLMRQPSLIGAESLTYSGDGLWVWRKPFLKRGATIDTISSVTDIIRAQ